MENIVKLIPQIGSSWSIFMSNLWWTSCTSPTATSSRFPTNLQADFNASFNLANYEWDKHLVCMLANSIEAQRHILVSLPRALCPPLWPSTTTHEYSSFVRHDTPQQSRTISSCTHGKTRSMIRNLRNQAGHMALEHQRRSQHNPTII